MYVFLTTLLHTVYNCARVSACRAARPDPRRENTSPTEVPDVRLVVTGHDGDNNGRFVSDSRIGPTPGLAADGWQAYVLWAVRPLPTLPDDGISAIDTLASGPGSVRFV